MVTASLSVLDVSLVLLCGTIAWTDIRRGIIPDWCNALIAAIGLLSVFLAGRDVLSSLINPILVLAIFVLIRLLYRRLRGHNGLGLGDVKFLAAATIRTGMTGFVMLLLCACVTGLLEIALRRLRGEPITSRTALRFGPHLALGFVAVIYLFQP